MGFLKPDDFDEHSLLTSEGETLLIFTGNKIEAAPAPPHHPGVGWKTVHVPAEGPRGPSPGRARDAALRPRQYPTPSRHQHLPARPGHTTLRRHPLVDELWPHRLGTPK